MTYLLLPEGPMKVVSAPDGEVPAPEEISAFLVGLKDGRLFIREDLLENPEITSYTDQFHQHLGAIRITWMKDEDFRKLRLTLQAQTGLPKISTPEPSPLPNAHPDETDSLSEDGPPDGREVSLPEALLEKVVLLSDGRIVAAEALRGDPTFDRFVRQYSLDLESRGDIGQFRIIWLNDRSLQDLRSGGQETDLWEDEADLKEDPVGVPDPESPPEESPRSGDEADRQISLGPDPDHMAEPGKDECRPDDLSEIPAHLDAGENPGTGNLAEEEASRVLQKKTPDVPAPSPEAPGQSSECLSSPSGGVIPDFRASDDIASMVLLFLDGRFYVSREHKTNQHVNYYCRHFVPELWPKIFGNRPVPNPQFVPYEHLRKMRLESLPEEAVTAGYKAEGDEARKIMEIIRDAIAKRASDIHLRVEKDRTRVLYRIHGWLKPVQTLTHDEGERLARIVYNTMLDSAGRDNMFSDKKPQDGQFRQDYLPRGVFNIREFHAPTGGTGLGTITMVLRLQYGSGNAEASAQDIDTLGYDPSHLALLRYLMGLSHGIVLFSGPMGSGKSTSMAAVLSIVLAMHPLEEGRGLHLATLEDPPEYVIPTASQIAVPGGLFSEVLGRIMRFDANILMIGEIRDEATAEKAIEGAMSGHVVYSTVHANDVLSIPRRLDGLKVRRDLLCDPTIFRGMVCQRLIPLLCPACKISWEEADRAGILRPDLAKRLADISGNLPKTLFFHHAGGCEICDGQGIVGRTIVAEILIPDQEILDLISAGRMTDAWRHFREKLEGKTMMDHALDKIRSGLVDPRDVEAKLGWIHKGLLDHRTVRDIVGGFS